MNNMPTIENDGNYTRVDVGSLVLHFSYNTLIAFSIIGGIKVVRENEWGSTTGKHLNMIDRDVKSRVNRHKFEELYQKYVTERA